MDTLELNDYESLRDLREESGLGYVDEQGWGRLAAVLITALKPTLRGPAISRFVRDAVAAGEWNALAVFLDQIPDALRTSPRPALAFADLADLFRPLDYRTERADEVREIDAMRAEVEMLLDWVGAPEWWVEAGWREVSTAEAIQEVADAITGWEDDEELEEIARELKASALDERRRIEDVDTILGALIALRDQREGQFDESVGDCERHPLTGDDAEC